jgi:fructokinase
MIEPCPAPTILGIELGGTKSIVALARGGNILERRVVPTSRPEETCDGLREAVRAWRGEIEIAAVGIASFGPIRVDSCASDYGTMLATPKPGWEGTLIAERLIEGFPVPWLLDTDVNAAALAEAHWGAGKNLSSLAYLTIGTGLGGGLVIGDQPVHGALHPEIGHIKLRRQSGDHFDGICPFHGDCAEGLLSGPAIQARFGMPGEDVDECDPRWQIVAADLGELIATISLVSSPQRILVGGGVGLGRSALFDAVRAYVLQILNGYLPHVTPGSVGTYIMAPALGADAGPLGAIALGETALKRNLCRDQQGRTQ